MWSNAVSVITRFPKRRLAVVAMVGLMALGISACDGHQPSPAGCFVSTDAPYRHVDTPTIINADGYVECNYAVPTLELVQSIYNSTNNGISYWNFAYEDSGALGWQNYIPISVGSGCPGGNYRYYAEASGSSTESDGGFYSENTFSGTVFINC